jgi:hypothetical protein
MTAPVYGSQQLTIASGSTLSDIVPINGTRWALFSPATLTSCSAFIDGATDMTSASCRRLRDPETGSAWAWSCGDGGQMTVLDSVLAGVPYARLGLSVAQTMPRSFVLISS